MSRALLGMNNCGAHNSKVYQFLKLNLSVSEETKKKQSIYTTNNNKFRGQKHSKFSKQLMSNAHKNKIGVRDDKGNFFKVYKDDPRYVSGEFVGNTKHKTLSEAHKIKISNNSNPRYTVATIYNNNNEIVFKSGSEPFSSFCKIHNLPCRVLEISYQNNGKPIYGSKSAKTKVKDTTFEKYIGWYAILE